MLYLQLHNIDLTTNCESKHFKRLLQRLLLIWSQPHGPENESGGGSIVAERLQRAAPAEVVRQVLGGDAMKAAQPLLQPPVIGIDVVEVEIGRLRVRLAGPRQDMRRDPGPARKGHDRAATIAAEDVGWRHDAVQSRSDRGAVQSWQYGVRGRALTVARDDHWDLFGGEAALRRAAASLARFPWHAGPFAFVGLQHECLVALDDPAQGFRLVAGQRRKEPMPPAERGGVVHPASAGSLGNANAVDQGVGLRGPLLSHTQPRQRRLGQRVEGAGTRFAAIARQAARGAPAHDLGLATVRATRKGHPLLPEVGDRRRGRRRDEPASGRASPLGRSSPLAIGFRRDARFG